MAAVYSEIIDKIRVFAGIISKEIRIQKLFLFGSYATGKANRDSDIDILVISDDFKKMSPIEVGFLLFRNAAKIPGDLQPIGYTYEEFLNNNNLFLREVLRNSQEIQLQ